MNNHDKIIQSIVEAGLEVAGKQSKEIIINYISYRYGLSLDSLARYKEEFANYLREILGQSADVIIAKIDRYMKENNVAAVDKNDSGSENPSSNVSAVTDGSLQTLVIQQGKGKDRISENVHFLICDNCLWCASLLVSNYPSRCMSCGKEIKSAVPIARNEQFAFELDPKRGVSLAFWS